METWNDMRTGLYYSLFVSITYLCGKARQQWRLSRLCAESIHLVSVHLWSVGVTGSKRRGGNINEIMLLFFFSASYQCGSARIQGFLTLAEEGTKQHINVYLVSSFQRKKKPSSFFSSRIPAVSSVRWCESRIVEMVARSTQPAI